MARSGLDHAAVLRPSRNTCTSRAAVADRMAAVITVCEQSVPHPDWAALAELPYNRLAPMRAWAPRRLRKSRRSSHSPGCGSGCTTPYGAAKRLRTYGWAVRPGSPTTASWDGPTGWSTARRRRAAECYPSVIYARRLRRQSRPARQLRRVVTGTGLRRIRGPATTLRGEAVVNLAGQRGGRGGSRIR